MSMSIIILSVPRHVVSLPPRCCKLPGTGLAAVRVAGVQDAPKPPVCPLVPRVSLGFSVQCEQVSRELSL